MAMGEHGFVAYVRHVYRGECAHCGKRLAIAYVRHSTVRDRKWVICGPQNGCGEVTSVEVREDESEAASPPERTLPMERSVPAE